MEVAWEDKDSVEPIPQNKFSTTRSLGYTLDIYQELHDEGRVEEPKYQAEPRNAQAAPWVLGHRAPKTTGTTIGG